MVEIERTKEDTDLNGFELPFVNDIKQLGVHIRYESGFDASQVHGCISCVRRGFGSVPRAHCKHKHKQYNKPMVASGHVSSLNDGVIPEAKGWLMYNQHEPVNRLKVGVQ